MPFTAIDLFAGAGGLSYGFERAGFDVVLAIEKDAWAIETYTANHRNQNALIADINTLDDSFFSQYQGKVDIVMGGPPCQGFSIAASNRRKEDDVRNTLYKQFLRAVSIIMPKVVLIENVKEIIGYRLPDGTKIINDIARTISDLGYCYSYQILNCKNYGIPQDRRRFFFLGIRNDIWNLPFHLEDLMVPFLSSGLTFSDAVSDLPEVKARQFPEDATMEYAIDPKNDFQRRLRGDCRILHNHIPMRHTDKTVERFKHILSKSEEHMPEELLPRVRGHVDVVSKASYSQNNRVIDANKEAPTITASFYSSFIHPTQPRNLTVREAARIQTFPDCFVFKGKKTTLSKKLLAKKGITEELHLDQFNQVGNAVPPLMAEHLAEICISFINGGEQG